MVLRTLSRFAQVGLEGSALFGQASAMATLGATTRRTLSGASASSAQLTPSPYPPAGRRRVVRRIAKPRPRETEVRGPHPPLTPPPPRLLLCDRVVVRRPRPPSMPPPAHLLQASGATASPTQSTPLPFSLARCRFSPSHRMSPLEGHAWTTVAATETLGRHAGTQAKGDGGWLRVARSLPGQGWRRNSVRRRKAAPCPRHPLDNLPPHLLQASGAGPSPIPSHTAAGNHGRDRRANTGRGHQKATQLHRRPPGYTLQQDTRLTERRQKDRFYRCDRCAAVKVYEGRIDGFDGIYLDDSWRGLIRFDCMRSAWKHGNIDITWWCRGCLSKVTGVRPACIGAKEWAMRF